MGFVLELCDGRHSGFGAAVVPDRAIARIPVDIRVNTVDLAASFSPQLKNRELYLDHSIRAPNHLKLC